MAKGEKSVAEVRRFLESKGFDPEPVFDRLRLQRIIDDGRLAKRIVASMIEDGKGPLACRQKLTARNIEEADVDAAIMDVGAEKWRSVMDVLISAKIKRGDNAAKIGRFLSSRGFEEDEVHAALARHFE